MALEKTALDKVLSFLFNKLIFYVSFYTNCKISHKTLLEDIIKSNFLLSMKTFFENSNLNQTLIKIHLKQNQAHAMHTPDFTK